jgi:hypothetical protein
MKITRESEKSVCCHCGVKTVTWGEERIINKRLCEVTCRRDYYPTTFAIRLRPDTASTYIVTPELERAMRDHEFSRIRSLSEGKLAYALDVDLPRTGAIGLLLDGDDRIEEWHTEQSAPVCDSHVDFAGNRW